MIFANVADIEEVLDKAQFVWANLYGRPRNHHKRRLDLGVKIKRKEQSDCEIAFLRKRRNAAESVEKNHSSITQFDDVFKTQTDVVVVVNTY